MRRLPPVRRVLKTALATAFSLVVVGPASNIVATSPLVLAQTTQAPAPLPTGAVSGVVTDATTGRPIEGAIVSLGRTDANEALPASATLPRVLTDSRGRFVFRNLPASDNYYIGARRLGYEPTRYGWMSPNGSRSTGDVRRVPVADGQWVNTISIPLWRLGAISGRVVDERNEPVVGVAVRVFSRARLGGNMHWVGGTVVNTDDRGMYRIPNLDAGAYVVGVLSVQSTVLDTTPEAISHLAVGEIETGAITMGSGIGQVSGPTIDADGTHRLAITSFATPPPPDGHGARAYPPAFYPDAATVTTAVPIDVNYGVDRSSVDLHLLPVPAVRVSGRLDGPIGAVPVNTLLRLLPVGDESLSFGSEVATTIVEPDGTFTFLNVPSGQYTLLAQPAAIDFTTGSASRRVPDPPGYLSNRVGVGGFEGAPGLSVLFRNGIPHPTWARVGVTVGTENVTGLVVPLRRTVKVSGRIVFAPGATPPPDDFRFPVTADPASGEPELGQAFGVIHNDAERTFTIDGLLTGRYVVDIAGYGVVSLVANGEDIKDLGIDATSGVDFTDVVATVTDKFARLAGVVRDNGSPAAAAVIVFPADRARWTNFGWHPQRIRESTAGSNGAFNIFRLPEGDYFLIAVDASRRDAWTDPVFLEAAAPLATAVTVRWGETKLVNPTIASVTVK